MFKKAKHLEVGDSIMYKNIREFITGVKYVFTRGKKCVRLFFKENVGVPDENDFFKVLNWSSVTPPTPFGYLNYIIRFKEGSLICKRDDTIVVKGNKCPKCGKTPIY